jgi:hypothetical protein
VHRRYDGWLWVRSLIDEDYLNLLQVSRLFPNPRFRGRPLNYANDIAIIELESPITLNAYVVPVCVDWENKDVPSLSGDSVGKVRILFRTGAMRRTLM